jgi:hypothetical protein
MDEVPQAELISEGRGRLELLGLLDGPAYIRRARGVEEALARLMAQLRAKRDELLTIPRLRLGTLHALAGGWDALHGLASLEAIAALSQLHEELAPRMRISITPSRSRARLLAALADVQAAHQRFNLRWEKHLSSADLSEVNRLRDGYNRYYVLEKACALRSDVLARHGFEPLPPLKLEDLRAAFPPLPVPEPIRG